MDTYFNFGTQPGEVADDVATVAFHSDTGSDTDGDELFLDRCTRPGSKPTDTEKNDAHFSPYSDPKTAKKRPLKRPLSPPSVLSEPRAQLEAKGAGTIPEGVVTEGDYLKIMILDLFQQWNAEDLTESKIVYHWILENKRDSQFKLSDYCSSSTTMTEKRATRAFESLAEKKLISEVTADDNRRWKRNGFYRLNEQLAPNVPPEVVAELDRRANPPEPEEENCRSVMGVTGYQLLDQLSEAKRKTYLPPDALRALKEGAEVEIVTTNGPRAAVYRGSQLTLSSSKEVVPGDIGQYCIRHRRSKPSGAPKGSPIASGSRLTSSAAEGTSAPPAKRPRMDLPDKSLTGAVSDVVALASSSPDFSKASDEDIVKCRAIQKNADQYSVDIKNFQNSFIDNCVERIPEESRVANSMAVKLEEQLRQARLCVQSICGKDDLPFDEKQGLALQQAVKVLKEREIACFEALQQFNDLCEEINKSNTNLMKECVSRILKADRK